VERHVSFDHFVISEVRPHPFVGVLFGKLDYLFLIHKNFHAGGNSFFIIHCIKPAENFEVINECSARTDELLPPLMAKLSYRTITRFLLMRVMLQIGLSITKEVSQKGALREKNHH